MPKLPRIEDIAPDEQKLCLVRKHSFGLFSVYAEIIVGFLAVLTVFYFFLPTFLTDASTSQLNGIVAMAAIIFGIIAWLGLTAFTFIYRGSYIIVTDRNVTQILQQGLFTRKVSELSLANVEDVTSQKHGVFATMFNYGKLFIETAGEAENFVFPYCPNPDYYGKIILDARHDFVQNKPSLPAANAVDQASDPPAPTPPPAAV